MAAQTICAGKDPAAPWAADKLVAMGVQIIAALKSYLCIDVEPVACEVASKNRVETKIYTTFTANGAFATDGTCRHRIQCCRKKWATEFSHRNRVYDAICLELS